MRKEVRQFAELMSRRLEEKAHKDKYGWKHITFDELLKKVDKFNRELHFVESDKDAVKKAVDIANYAMMIADNCREGESDEQRTVGGI